MKVLVRIKSAGSRKPLANREYEVAGPATLAQLLAQLVEAEVARYNTKDAEGNALAFLTQQEVDDAAEQGKVSFGATENPRKADPAQAVENALQCFRDGLVRAFINGEEATQLDAPLALKTGAEITLIRMIFLAGRMW